MKFARRGVRDLNSRALSPLITKTVSRPRKPAIGFIFVTLFLDILGIGLIIPILPKLIEQFEGGNVEAASHVFGLLVALYSVMQLVCSPILGSLSDHFGRRPIILGSLLGSALDYLFLAFAPSLGWFFVGRAIAGITGANITAASAYIADVSPPEKRSQNFGIIGAAFGLGFIAGPALGGILGDIGLRLPFLVAAGMTLLNWLYGMFVLPESLPMEHRRAFTWARSNLIGSLVALRRYPLVWSLAGTYFLVNVAQFSLQSIWVLYTGYRYHWNVRQTGLSLAVVGVTAAFVQGYLVRKIIPALGEKKSITLGLLIGTGAMIGYGLAPEGWMIYLILVLGCFGGIAMPSIQGMISHSVQVNEQGAVQGSLNSISSIAGIVAPPMSTSLFGYFISKSAPWHLPGVSFFVAALLMLLGLVQALRSIRKHPMKPIGSAAETPAEVQPLGH